MKYIILLLAMVAASCDAQQAKTPDLNPKAPVNIAFSLYAGCMTGWLNGHELPATKKAIDERIVDLNLTCLQWTIAWYPPMVGDTEFRMADDDLARFEANRQRMLADLNKDIIQLISKPKK